MAISNTDILNADSAITRAILLSEQTQLILLSAMSFVENRQVWVEMSDSAWDDFENIIAECFKQVLVEDSSSGGTVAQFRTVARISSTQSISAGTPTAIQWNTGADYDSGNPTRLNISENGLATIACGVHFTAGTAPVGYVEIRKNGGTIKARHDLSVVGTNYLQIACIDGVNNGDYYEVLISTNQTSTLQVSTHVPNLSALIMVSS